MIHIVTPVTRPQNIERILLSILCSNATAKMPWQWWLIVDMAIPLNDLVSRLTNTYLPGSRTSISLFHLHTSGVSGNPQRDCALNQIEDGYVCFIDDDNIVHPWYFDGISHFIEMDYQAMVYGQCFKDGRVRHSGSLEQRNPHNTSGHAYLGILDSAQFTLSRKLIGDIGWPKESYQADGIFISEVLSKVDPAKEVGIEACLSYYNLLRQ